MKTKEEILRKYVFTEEWNFEDVVLKENAIKAMEEYAQQQVKEMIKNIHEFAKQNYQGLSLFSLEEIMDEYLKSI